MIVVRIELWSAITGQVTEIGRMHISNVGGTRDGKLGDYDVEVMRRGTKDKVLRKGSVTQYPRLSYNVWRLICRALLSAFPEEK